MPNHHHEHDPKIPSPKEAMRTWRPYLFSDSESAAQPQLPRASFEHHLETLTSRKEETPFEHFCRRLAEKELCPNLRVQTGPTGGGDSKVDSETYPVADGIAERWWVGQASAGARWAFAFSAKKTWQPKAKSDVASIVSTGRGYRLIYFITNQNAPDKKRAALEDRLAKLHDVEVRILDRQWIADKVYANGHLEMAISTLGIEGASSRAEKRTGPRDLARTRELDDLDKDVADPDRYQGARYQLVEDCLRTAVLARGLERPRAEIEMRLALAGRLAAERGDRRQQLRVAYARAWTTYWWLEDFGAFNKAYDEVEGLVCGSSEAADIGRSQTLWQLLLPLVRGGRLLVDAARINERRQGLERELSRLASNASRPNNAADARTSLALTRLTWAMHESDTVGVGKQWQELSLILDDVDALGSYSVDKLHEMLTRLGEAVDSAEFDKLYEKSVDIVRRRRSDAEAGEAYCQRAGQKLKHGKPYDAIRWFGLAERLLVKDETRLELVDALLGASVAYQQAGLDWAARNKSLAAAERMLDVIGRQGTVLLPTLIALQSLAHVELTLGRVPHAINAMGMADSIAARLKLKGHNAKVYEETRTQQEAVLGLHLLRVAPQRLSSLTRVHDTLDRLGMHAAAYALLYSLGDRAAQRKLGYVSDTTTDADEDQLFKSWVRQPAADELDGEPHLLEGDRARCRSVILGCEIIVNAVVTRPAISLTEAVLGALEAFAATSTENDVAPHRDRFELSITSEAGSQRRPELEMTDGGSTDATVVVGADFEIRSAEDMAWFSNWLKYTIMGILVRIMTIRNPQAWLERIAGAEEGFTRAITFSNTFVLNENVFGRERPLRIQDLAVDGAREFPVSRTTSLRPVEEAEARTGSLRPGRGEPPVDLIDLDALAHSDRKVLSPIDTSLWDRAKWKGTLFGCYQDDVTPPVMGLMFTDEQAAVAIFRQWCRRWSAEGSDAVLRVMIVQGLERSEPATYAISVGPMLDRNTMDDVKLVLMVSRINRMTPSTSINLERFLAAYHQRRQFFIAPAVWREGAAEPELLMEHRLLRANLEVRHAWEIGENDPDACVLHNDDDPVIPPGIAEPPVRKALAMMRRLRDRECRRAS